jgi:glycosyltransferase involved in cell wall biosynthesis
MKKPLNVFYAVQVSNFTTNGDKSKWLIRNDACMNICIGIVSSILTEYPKDFKFIIKVPPVEDCADIESHKDLFDEKYLDRIEFYEDFIPISPVISRFHFDMNTHKVFGSKKLANVDVMINDENTHTKSWRVFFENIIGRRIPMVSTNYFMDSPISPKSDPKVRYYERQMESLISSDMFSYPVSAALNEALEAYDFLFKDGKILGTPTVWNIGASFEEINKKKVTKSPGKIKIYFGNRITDSANRYTNWHIFAEAIGKLSQRIDPSRFTATILNPTKKITPEQLDEISTLSRGFVEVVPNYSDFSREDYVNFINEAHISCNLFTNEVHGGLTHVEAMMAGCILVAPNVNDYLYKYEDSGKLSDYPFLIDTYNKKMDMDSFVSKLELAVNTAQNKQSLEKYSEMNRELAYKYASYEMSSHIIAKDLKKLATLYK